MRVSSLSDDRVIRLVSRHFVPAWISRDRHQLGEASQEEKALVAKIDADRRRKKLEGGAVCVYIATADGAVLATLPVQKAWKPELLAPFLRKLVADNKLTARSDDDVKASKAPEPPAPRPQAPGGRLFTSRVRFDGAGGNRGVGRDTIELSRAEVASLLPPRLAVGQGHAVPRATAAKLLLHAYPPLPHWSDKQAKLTECSLSMRVIAAGKGGASLRIEGRVKMIYPHQGKPTDGQVSAPLVGVATTDAGGALKSLVIVADGGKYVTHWQGQSHSRAIGIAIELEK